VNNEADVDILRGRESSKLLKCPLLRIKALKATPRGAAKHELQVVDNDVLHIVSVCSVLYRIEHFVDIRCAEEVHEVDW
jgi:hypothetical protein